MLGLTRCLLAAVMMLWIGSLFGCETTPQAGGLNQALGDYEAGRSAIAHSRAVKVARAALAADDPERALSVLEDARAIDDRDADAWYL